DVREFTDAGDAFFSACEVSATWGECRIDLLPDPASFNCLQHASTMLNLLKNAPGMLGNLIREPFQIPTPARRLDYSMPLTLCVKDKGGIASDPATEAVRQAQHGVERHGSDEVGPTDRGAITCSRIAEQIHVRVAQGQDTLADAGVDSHGPCGR